MTPSVTPALRRLLGWALVVWMVAVAVAGAAMAMYAMGFEVLGTPRPTRWEPEMRWGLAIVAIVCTIPTLATRMVRPTATYPVALAAAGVVAAAAAVGSGTVPALVPVAAIIVVSFALGDLLLRLLPRPIDRAARLVVAVALGNGLLALLLLSFASIRMLNATFVAGSFLLIVVAWLAAVRPFPSAGLGWRDVRLPAPSWFETILVAMTATLLAFALLYAFTPEIHSDSVRHHLPIAREFWRVGSAPLVTRLWTSEFPVHAHVLYAVGWGFGGDAAAKLVHAGLGLVAFGSIFVLGRLLAGRLAGVAATALFASIPIALWELGSAYVDLFPVLFIVAAVTAGILSLELRSRGWLFAAGALAGFAYAAKVATGTSAAGVGAAAMLVGRGRFVLRERAGDVLAFVLGGLLIVPWLIRSYLITDRIPGLDILVQAVGGERPHVGANLADFGVGRGPLELLTLPLSLTFDADRFTEVGFGWMGVALLLALPLGFMAPRKRSTAFLVVSLLVAFVGWVLTAQYLRYGLPWMALLCVLLGSGVAAVAAPGGVRVPRALARGVPFLVAGAIIVTPLLWLPSTMGFLMHQVYTGSSREEVTRRYVPAYEMLTLASELLPRGTRVAWIGVNEPSQLYTETSPDSIDASRLGDDPLMVVQALDAERFDYVLWNRTQSSQADWQATVTSTPFLRDYTRILGASDGAYLFEVFDEPGVRWGLSDEDLLHDGAFERADAAGPWNLNDAATISSDGLRLGPGGLASQAVDAHTEGPYVLTFDASCSDQSSAINPSLRWFDRGGNPLGLTWELLRPGTAGREQFVWSRRPTRATSVVVVLESHQGSDCTVRRATLQGPAVPEEATG